MEQKQNKTTYLSAQVYKRVKHYRWLFYAVVLLLVADAAVEGWRIYQIKPIFKAFEAGNKDWSLFEKYALILVGLSLLMFPISYFGDYLSKRLQQVVARDVRNDLCEHTVHLPLNFFTQRKHGDTISRITNDVNLFEGALAFLLDDIFRHPAKFLIGLVVIMYAHWVLGVMTLIVFPFFAFPMYHIARKVRKKRKQSLEQLGDVTESLVQMHSGIRIVKAYHQESAEVQKFREKNQSFFNKLLSVIRRKALSESMVEVFLGLGIAILAFVGGYFIQTSGITAPDLALFAPAVGIMISMAIRDLTKGYNKFQESLAGLSRIFEILNIPRVHEPEATNQFDGVRRGIEYQSVSFAYDTEPVLQGINLKIAPNEVVAIVGRSGSGKSTLVDLLCRFYEPTRGSILIDGQDLRSFSRASLLEHVAIVSQDPFLFNATIAENIRYGKRDATQEEVTAAAKAAHIHEYIQTLTEKYEAVVGERGVKLSGGQRQRIAIARALIKNPAILILDEATSSLDSESEAQVQQAINALVDETALSHRIILIVAHRLSTVRKAHRIVVLDEGRIAEIGTHEELLPQNGVYTALYRS